MTGDARRLVACKERVEVERKLRPLEERANRLDDELRGFAIASGAGFTERVDDRTQVIVTAGSVSKLKGLLPVLDAENFLTLPDRVQKKRIEDGEVSMVEQWTQVRKPSVKVEL